MPYVIQKLCSATETACMEACPFDCIYPTREECSTSTKPLFYIDAEECTNCGACALSCPESAIVPAKEFGRYSGPGVKSKNNVYDAHLSVLPSDTFEPPALEIIAQEWLTTFVASHL
jgi:ferredoxin--NADP+ reductase